MIARSERSVYTLSQSQNEECLILDEAALSENGRLLAIGQACHFNTNRNLWFALEEDEQRGYFLHCLGQGATGERPLFSDHCKAKHVVKIAGPKYFRDNAQFSIQDGPSLLVSSDATMNLYAFSSSWEVVFLCSLRCPYGTNSCGVHDVSIKARDCSQRVGGRSICGLQARSSRHISGLWAWVDLRAIIKSYGEHGLWRPDMWVQSMPWWHMPSMSPDGGKSQSRDKGRTDAGWNWIVQIGSDRPFEACCTVPFSHRLSNSALIDITAACFSEHAGRCDSILAIERSRGDAFSTLEPCTDVAILLSNDQCVAPVSRKLPSHIITSGVYNEPFVNSIKALERHIILSLNSNTLVCMSPENLEILALFEDISMYSILRNGPFVADLVLIPKSTGLFNSSVVSLSDMTSVFQSPGASRTSVLSEQGVVLLVKLSRGESRYLPRKKVVRRTNFAPDDELNKVSGDMAVSIGAGPPGLPLASEDVVIDEGTSRQRKKKHKSDRSENINDGEYDRNKSSKRRRRDRESGSSGAGLMQTALMLRIEALTSRCERLRAVLSEKRRLTAIMQFAVARSVVHQAASWSQYGPDRSKLQLLLPESATLSMQSVFPHLLEEKNNTSASNVAPLQVAAVAIEIEAFSIRYLPSGKGVIATVCVANHTKTSLYGLSIFGGGDLVELSNTTGSSSQSASTYKVRTRSGVCPVLSAGQKCRLSCYISCSYAMFSITRGYGIALYASYSCPDSRVRVLTAEDVIFSYQHRLGDIRMIRSSVVVGFVPIVGNDAERNSLSYLRWVFRPRIPTIEPQYSANYHRELPAIVEEPCFGPLIVERLQLHMIEKSWSGGSPRIAIASLQHALERHLARTRAMVLPAFPSTSTFCSYGMSRLENENSVILVVVPAADNQCVVGNHVALIALRRSSMELAKAELSRILVASFGVKLISTNGDRLLPKSRSSMMLRILQRAATSLLSEADSLALSWKAQNTRTWGYQLASLLASRPGRTQGGGVVSGADAQSRGSGVPEAGAGLVRVGNRLTSSPQLSASLAAAQIRSDFAVGDAIRAIENMQLI